jgi:hypothetical protein
MTIESIKVKPLEWYADPGAFPYKTWGAQSPFGRFIIEEVSASDSPAYEARYTPHHLIAIKDALPEAQEVCQADYERRILSALSHSPVEQETGTGALVRLGRAVLSEAPVEATQFMGVTLSEIRDALAPIAHTFHIDPVSRESVRDEVEGNTAPSPNVAGSPTFWIWRIPGGDWLVSEREPSSSGATDVECYQVGATPVSRIEALELTLKPFADIAPCVEYTDKRDGDVVHRRGYAVVPMKPTDAMLAAGIYEADPRWERSDLYAAWERMVEVAQDEYLYEEDEPHPPQQEPARLREALESIARNTCCDSCQEAALVARAALAAEGQAE